MALLKETKRKKMFALVPRNIYQELSSPEFKYELYTRYLKKQPTSQGHVDQVYNSIKYELFYIVQLLYFKQHEREDPYMYFSQNFLKHLFKKKYLVIKELLGEKIGMEAKSSCTSRESYMEGKEGFTKAYRSNIDLSITKMKNNAIKNRYGKSVMKRIDISYPVSKRLKDFAHRYENQEFINLVDDCQLMIEIDEMAPEHIKEEFENLPTMLTKKRTDNRYYGMGSGSSKESRKWMYYNGEKLVEVDLSSAYVHFSVANCYDDGNLDHLEEKMRLTISMNQQNIYDQIVDMFDFTRDSVKILFNSIMNNKVTDPMDLNLQQRAVWSYINDKYPIYAQYMLRLNTKEYGEKMEDKLQRKLYNDASRIAYLFNSKEESDFMTEFITRFTDKYGKMGFLWVHDGIYLPESYAENGEEMMKALFEELYGYTIN